VGHRRIRPCVGGYRPSTPSAWTSNIAFSASLTPTVLACSFECRVCGWVSSSQRHHVSVAERRRSRTERLVQLGANGLPVRTAWLPYRDSPTTYIVNTRTTFSELAQHATQLGASNEAVACHASNNALHSAIPTGSFRPGADSQDSGQAVAIMITDSSRPETDGSPRISD
jgi:hypothetical protein